MITSGSGHGQPCPTQPLVRFHQSHADRRDVRTVLQRDGICVLEEVIAKDILDQLRHEALALATLEENWIVRNETTSGFFLHFSPLVARKVHREARIERLVAVFGHRLLMKVARDYLGPGWFVDRIILDRKDPGPEPLTGWHADQFERHGKCLKFMLYLNDTGITNGAFSYVMGSHRLIDWLVTRASTAEMDHRIHTYEEIRKIADRLDLQGETYTRIRWMLSETAAHITSEFESDDFYSITAPAGSIIVFDANGIHRGGVVSTGERFIARTHCKPLQPALILSSKVAFMTFLERLFFRWTTAPGSPRLI